MKILKEYIQMIINGHINALLCHSKAGYGKTYNVLKELKTKDIPHKYISGVTTAVELYKLMYDHNEKILVLDDIETLFQNDRIINLLKSALWNAGNKRIVGYKTTHKSLETYPNEFEYTGRMIILANEIKGVQDKTFYALMSRCLVYELKFTTKELAKKSFEIINKENTLTQPQKTKAIKLVKKYNKTGYEYNLRMLRRIISFVKYNMYKAEMLYDKSVQKNDIALIVEKIITNYPIEQQLQQFKEETGKSKSTFFRVKKEILKEE